MCFWWYAEEFFAFCFIEFLIYGNFERKENMSNFTCFRFIKKGTPSIEVSVPTKNKKFLKKAW